MKNFTKISKYKWSRTTNIINKFSENEFKKIDSVIATNDIINIYMPLVHYLYLFVHHKHLLLSSISQFINAKKINKPFIIGIAGPVAVGKSTVSRLIETLLKSLCPTLKVQLITTDDFLYPNRELKKRDLMDSKGFPESYNIEKLIDFLSDINSGQKEVFYPLYSHKLSDIVPENYGKITNPDILIIEGVNTLQTSINEKMVTPSDFLNFSIYIDANESLIRIWFLQRFVHFLVENRNNPTSFYYSWANRTKEEALEMAEKVWQTVNLVNLREYIEPTKTKANIILHKTYEHKIDYVYLRNY